MRGVCSRTHYAREHDFGAVKELDVKGLVELFGNSRTVPGLRKFRFVNASRRPVRTIPPVMTSVAAYQTVPVGRSRCRETVVGFPAARAVDVPDEVSYHI